MVLGLAAVLLLLMAFGSGAMALMAPHMPAPVAASGASSTALMPGVMLFMMLLYLAVAVWAGSTVAGLLRMRSWARISVIVLGIGVAVFGLFGVLGTLAAQTMLPSMPLPPGVGLRSLRAIFLVLTFFWMAGVGVGIWWVVYFALRRTREAFRAAAPPPMPQSTMAGTWNAAPMLPKRRPASQGPITDFTVAQPIEIQAEELPTPAPMPVQYAPPAATYTPAPEWPERQPTTEHGRPIALRKRPVSITVVAVLLLIGSFFALLQMTSPFPIFLWGALLTGWPAHISMLMLCAVSGVAGLGLLRLQRSAWGLAVGLYSAYLLNAVTMALPGGSTRFMSLMRSANENSPFAQGMQVDPRIWHIAALFSACIGVLFAATMLVLLWRARRAFEAPAADQAAL